MWSILIPATSIAIDALSAELWELGTAGLVEEECGLRAFFDDSVNATCICARFALAPTEVRREPPFDPTTVSPFECDAVLIGDRFYLAPSWLNEPAPEGRFHLTIEAATAFGSGRHESTQLCMEALEKHLHPGSVVIDLGCGSGILSAAAHLLGAAAVFSCDIHADSVRAAKMMIETPLFVGSADAVKTGVADMVLANISAKILDVLAADLRRIAKPTALILLAGFPAENPPKHFRPREVFKKGDWECWVSRPEDIEGVQVLTEPATHSEQWWL